MPAIFFKLYNYHLSKGGDMTGEIVCISQGGAVECNGERATKL